MNNNFTVSKKVDVYLDNLLTTKPEEVYWQNNDGITAVHYVVDENNVDMLRLFLDKVPRDIFDKAICVQDNKLHNPLHVAAIKGNSENINSILRCLLQKEIQESSGSLNQRVSFSGTQPALFQQDMNGQTPLHLFVKYGRIEVFESLYTIKNLRKVVWQALKIPDNDGNTAFHLSVSFGRIKILDFFLQQINLKKVKPFFYKNNLSCTPIHMAALKGDVEMMKMFAKNKKLYEFSSLAMMDRSVVHLAAMAGHASMLQFFIKTHDKGVLEPLMQQKDKHGKTPLELAQKYKKSDAIKILTSFITR